MKLNKLIIIVICASIFSFSYGVATIQFKLFPFEQLRFIKTSLSSRDDYSPYFYDRKSIFELHGNNDYTVVFIGDSLTDYGEWQDLFPSLTTANRGIKGDTSSGVINRIDSIISTYAPSAFILIGVNDLLSGISEDQLLKNYQEIINKLMHSDMDVYIQSIIYTDNKRPILNKQITSVNEQLKLLDKTGDSVTYIDLNAVLAPNALLDSRYSRDGIHLNGEGYSKWKEVIKPFIQ